MVTGSTEMRESRKQALRCIRCQTLYYWDKGHSESLCKYTQRFNEVIGIGYAKIDKQYYRLLVAARVPLITMRKEDVVETYQNYRNRIYAPAWAVVACERSGLGHLTRPSRPRAKAFIKRLEQLSADQDEQLLMLGDEILREGKHKRACRLFLRARVT
jgi:hypothetical protein